MGGAGSAGGVCHSASYSSFVAGTGHHPFVLPPAHQGAIEPVSLTPGFYSYMFMVTKVSGGWRPTIDLSTLNNFVVRTPFRMETTQSVLRSIRRNDWMVSVDLKDAYLQVPIHPSSRRFLRFVEGGRTWQFRVLCFGLTTAP